MLDPVPGRTATELARDAGAGRPGSGGRIVAAPQSLSTTSPTASVPGTEPAYRMIADLDDHLRHHGPARLSRPTARPAPPDGWVEVR